jgi:hypothetical protein
MIRQPNDSVTERRHDPLTRALIRGATVFYGLSNVFFGLAGLVAPSKLVPWGDPRTVEHMAGYVAARNLPIAAAMFLLATRRDRRWDSVHGAFLAFGAAVQAIDAVLGGRALALGGHELGPLVAPAILTLVFSASAVWLLRRARPLPRPEAA